ncbi:ASCH domain-containing protein [Photobacterium sp. TY1-4]|uniref:ASCH domain-containing protein n=1 Tax=Photobacterium sp. TY1-4 TaxID=2899122 RepID=UPI0021BFE203|nr:ASCH domain-containing protein [Photobacterium sp. TY1-4]UXI03009.1 ASCH domain-containing protein [Photobacterium sp. TY1-4]
MEVKAQQYLDSYLNTLSEADRQRHNSFSADYFCADEVNANLCAELVTSGAKTATCSMKYWYEDGGETMPQAGHLQVVTDWHGNPKAIIKITSICECRFADVGEDFARAEGEGDLSLAWWRKAHWDFFSAECDEVGIEPSEQMVLVLEHFQVVCS